MGSNIKETREHDYVYDPNFILCHQNDFKRQAQRSAIASAHIVLCPVFENMFCDLNKFTRNEKVCHLNSRLPDHVEIFYENNKQNVNTTANESKQINGRKLPLLYARPKVDNILVLHLEKSPKMYIPIATKSHKSSPGMCQVHTRRTQTIYRDSSVQTDPFEPKYYFKLKCRQIPEIYLLDNVNSCNENAILTVEKQRVRRAWLQNKSDSKVMSVLENYDYYLREKEIENMLLMIEESSDRQILSKVDLQRLKHAISDRLTNKLMSINDNKKKAYTQIETKRSNLKAPLYGKFTAKTPSTLLKKPYKLAINLNDMPFGNDYQPLNIDLEPSIKSKYGFCDKLEKKKERYLAQIKNNLQLLREPSPDYASKDIISWLEESRESTVDILLAEEEIEPFVDTANKSTAIDFLHFMAEKK